MSPEIRQDTSVAELSREKAALDSVNGLIRSRFGRIAVVGSALALAVGVAAERADAEASLDITQVCIGPNTAQTTLTIKDYTARDIEPTRVEVATAPSLDEFGSPPSRPWPLVTGRTLSELLSPSRPAGDGVATPAYNGEALYSGTTTIISSNLPNGPQYLTTYLSWVNPDFPDTGYGRAQTTNPPIDCSGTTPLVGGNTVSLPPVTTQPPVPPAKLLNLGLKLQAAKILPSNRKGNLKVTSELNSDSTCSISGVGDGASPNAKLRKQAARIEVNLKGTKLTGKQPKGTVALNNGKPVKKIEYANTVSIDLRSSGLKPGEQQINNLAFRLPRGLKSGGFSAKLIVPASASECGAKTITGKLTSKSKQQ